jgi:alginate O-acetyltransferase complex protein AlgI
VPVFGGGTVLVTNYLWILVAAATALILPNVAQIFSRHDPVLFESAKAFREIRAAGMLKWDFNSRWALIVAIASLAGILTLQQVSEFLYFQF